MNLEEMRRGIPFTLPICGLDVHLRQAGVLDLIALGQLPETLSATAEQSLGTDGRLRIDDFAKQMPLIDLVAGICFVSPKVPEEMAITEIPVADRIAIFQWANVEVEPLRPFHEEQAGRVATLPVVDDLHPTTE